MHDPLVGAQVIGYSVLLGARGIRLLAIGSLRDPVTALREFPRVQQAAIAAGYPEQAMWAMFYEMELRYALGNTDGIHTLAQSANRLAENLGGYNEIGAAICRCDLLDCGNDWHAVVTVATDRVSQVRARGAARLFESRLLALIGAAPIELGNVEAGRAAAHEGVAFVRASNARWSPRSFAVLAQAQLALTETVADIASTLDEYEALFTRTGFHVYEGELHELRARLAEREGQQAERVAVLNRAFECYTRVGMAAQAARVADALGDTA